MAAPKTLFELAGASPGPHHLSESAVVMIDAQREYRDGRLALPGIEEALESGAELLERARSAGRPVLHVQHRGRAGGLFDPETTAFEICAPVAPLRGEAVVVKALPNSFAGTDLEARLRGLEVKNLIVGGFMTHMCVSSSLRAALDLGFGATLVTSATATRDLPDGAGGVIAAETLKRAELAALGDRFAMLAERASDLPD